MNRAFSNRVIVFGADHHNTLAVIRCLGKHNCRIHTIIHTNDPSQKQRISYSKFAENLNVLKEDENEILNWLLNNTESSLQIIFPCSDFAMQLIDTNYELLKSHYIIPGFKNAPGKVHFLMDKMRQKELAERYNLPMAQTWSLKLTGSALEIPDNIVYPCILKPELSTDGKKNDICIAQDEAELLSLLSVLKNKGYSDILVQKFLFKKYELCSLGVITQAEPHFFGITIKKLREYPKTGGSNLTYSRLVREKDADELTKKVLSLLYDEGYRGMYDVELLVCEDKVYLNEINFRHSGNGEAMVSENIPAPYIHCLDLLHLPIPYSKTTAQDSFFVDDVVDCLTRRDYNVSLLTIIKDNITSKSHSVFSFSDLGGTVGFCMPLAKAFIKKTIKKLRG